MDSSRAPLFLPEPREREWPNRYTYVLAGIACLNSLNLGYDTGSIGGAAVIIEDDLGLSDEEQQIFIGAASIMSIFGALLAPPLCDHYGRRKTFLFSCVVFITGLLLVTASVDFAAIMVGRVITGLGIGLGLAIDPLYISEISPPWHRGHLVSMSEISINFGIVLGFLANLAFYSLPENISWRIIIGIGILMPMVLAVLVVFKMPESPRWLVAQKRTEEAKQILSKTYPPGVDMDAVIGEIEAVLEKEQEGAKEGWKPILRPSPAVKLMLLAGVGLGIMQQLNGSEAFIYYSPRILEDAGFDDRGQLFAFMVLIGMCKLSFIGVGAYYVDDTGRRPLLMRSTLLMALFLTLLAFSFPEHNLSGLTIFLICAFVGAFSIGVGPICWLGVAEVFPLHLRAKAMSLATFANRATAALVANTVITLNNEIGVTGFFLLYAGFTLFSCYYLYRYFPETMGKTLEEMTVVFQRTAVRIQEHGRPSLWKTLHVPLVESMQSWPSETTSALHGEPASPGKGSDKIIVEVAENVEVIDEQKHQGFGP